MVKHKVPSIPNAAIDQRFAAVQTDPRFQRLPKAQRTVQIDDRFKGMFTDARFQGATVVDKRGRKVKRKVPGEDLKRYYRAADQADESQHRRTAAPPAAEQQTAGEEAAERWARLRGLQSGQVSSSEASSDQDGAVPDALAAEAEAAEEDAAAWGAGALAANPDEDIPQAEETARLALVDLDWDHISAEDILAVLRSFLKRGQSIVRVAVYPSDYGLQRMAEEAVMGPRLGPQKAQQSAAHAAGKAQQQQQARALLAGHLSDEDTSEGSDVDSDLGSEGLDADAAAARPEDSDSGEEVDPRALALYERSRLRYFYAVVECDSVATAAALYSECDGLEFERSSNKLDLRFVPDEQDLSGRAPRDTATQVQGGYEAPDFHTKALQHSRPQLTWDADEAGRSRSLARKVNAEQLRDDDFKAYLASSSDEEKPSGNAARYQALLSAAGPGKQRTGGKAWSAPKAEEAGSSDDADKAANDQVSEVQDEEGDLEVTFGPGLEALSAKLAEKAAKGKKRDTLWEDYLRRRSEKRKAAKSRRQQGSSDDDDEDLQATAAPTTGTAAGDSFFQHAADPFADPFFHDAGPAAQPVPLEPPESQAVGDDARKGDKASRREEAAAKRRQAAELELLLLDEGKLRHTAAQGNSQPAAAATPDKLGRKARLKAKRAARLRERQAGSDDDDVPAGTHFKVDVADPRFQALFTSKDHALDPTDPQFAKAGGSAAILAEAARRKAVRGHSMSAAVPQPKARLPESLTAGLIHSLKRKAKQRPAGAAKWHKPFQS